MQDVKFISRCECGQLLIRATLFEDVKCDGCGKVHAPQAQNA